MHSISAPPSIGRRNTANYQNNNQNDTSPVDHSGQKFISDYVETPFGVTETPNQPPLSCPLIRLNASLNPIVCNYDSSRNQLYLTLPGPIKTRVMAKDIAGLKHKLVELTHVPVDKQEIFEGERPLDDQQILDASFDQKIISVKVIK